MKTGPKPKPLDELFWAKVRKGDGCWEWLGGTSHLGYGAYSWREAGKSFTRGAHRLSWELSLGPIPKGLCVCHVCDNPLCVNPQHLFLGTHKDNSQDMAKKGRSTHGEKNRQAKLCADDVLKIRELRRLGWTYQRIAEKFNVTMSPVRDVCKGRAWLRVL